MFPHNDTTRLFTGSAVVDTNNTSGFFPDQSNGVVAIHTVDMKWPAVKQVQELSYSTDGGYSFKRWDRNPILDVGSSQFRDPKVIRHGDKWIMVVAYAADLTLGVYSSFNLKEWRHESNITHVGLLGDQYECPNLVQIPVEDTDQSAWLLQISINPGAPLGGSVIQYVPGDFNGTHFSPFDRAARLSNFGKDDYAAQFFYDEPVSIGWTSNWQYCDKTPTAEEGWRGTTTIPRRHSLVKDPIRGYEMRQVPVDLTPALGDRLLSSEQLANDKPLVRDFKNGVYLDMNVTLPQDVESPAGASFNITFTSPSNDEFKAQYFFGGPMANTTFLNRKNDAWDHPAYTDVASFSQTHTAERYQLILDRVVVEAFVDNGRGHGVMATYAKRPYDSVKIAAGSLPEGMTLTVELHDLKDTWKSASGKE